MWGDSVNNVINNVGYCNYVFVMWGFENYVCWYDHFLGIGPGTVVSETGATNAVGASVISRIGCA